MPSVPSPATVDLAVLGTVIRVCLDNPADAEVIEALWHLCVLPTAPRDVPEARVVKLPTTADAAARGHALTALTQEVTRAAISAQSGRQLMLHAGALSNLETGATVAYVAPAGTGKTTITRTLGRGRGYITDETVAVTRSGEIVPYPKPLSVRGSAPGKDEIAPRDFGLQPAGARPWLASLLAMRRDPAHVGEPSVREVGTLDAIVALSPETSALASLPQPLATCREIIDRVGGLVHVTFRDATQLEEIVSGSLGRERP